MEEFCHQCRGAQVLAQCWRDALGHGPKELTDTLREHGVTGKQRKRLLFAIRLAFGFELAERDYPTGVPFCKTAKMLDPLLNKDGDEPSIWFAPGRFGMDPGDLLFASAYRGPGRLRLLRYPDLQGMTVGGGVIEAHVRAVLNQLPLCAFAAEPGRPGLMLAGNSSGAHIMHEVACRLVKRGIRVAGLTLINSVVSQQHDLPSYGNHSLSDCRSRRQFKLWATWRLATESRSGLRRSAQTISALKLLGAQDRALCVDKTLCSLIRFKAFSYSIRHQKYPGKIVLLRPSVAGSHPEREAGWGPFCQAIEVHGVPFSSKQFLTGTNRQIVADKLRKIVQVWLAPGS